MRYLLLTIYLTVNLFSEVRVEYYKDYPTKKDGTYYIKSKSNYVNGLKNGLEELYKIEALCTQVHANNSPIIYYKMKTISYINGKKNGPSITYSKNGKIKRSIEYKNDIRYGMATSYKLDNNKNYRNVFFQNGKIVAERKVSLEDNIIYLIHNKVVSEKLFNQYIKEQNLSQYL